MSTAKNNIFFSEIDKNEDAGKRSFFKLILMYRLVRIPHFLLLRGIRIQIETMLYEILECFYKTLPTNNLTLCLFEAQSKFVLVLSPGGWGW